jgi:hypothetical protein
MCAATAVTVINSEGTDSPIAEVDSADLGEIAEHRSH